ncbi:hypothetical protein GCM10009856_18560 [Mycolicibacterium llatzerense]
MSPPPSGLRNVAIDHSGKVPTCTGSTSAPERRRMTVIGGVAYVVVTLLPVLTLAAINAMVRAIGRRRGRPDPANEDS